MKRHASLLVGGAAVALTGALSLPVFAAGPAVPGDSAVLSGQALTGITGAVQLNEAAGNGNAQANGIVIGLDGPLNLQPGSVFSTTKAIGPLSSQELRGVSGSSGGSAAGAPSHQVISPDSVRTATVGVAQISQTAGDNNLTGNLIGVSLGGGMP